MRILLDESLPRQLAGELRPHEVSTVQSHGWSGKKNGDLLRCAEAEGFSIFLTADQGLPFQQNLQNSGLGVIVIRAQSNRLEHLLPLVPNVLAALGTATPGMVVEVGGAL